MWGAHGSHSWLDIDEKKTAILCGSKIPKIVINIQDEEAHRLSRSQITLNWSLRGFN